METILSEDEESEEGEAEVLDLPEEPESESPDVSNDYTTKNNQKLQSYQSRNNSISEIVWFLVCTCFDATQ